MNTETHPYTAADLMAAAQLDRVTYDQWKARGRIWFSADSLAPGKPHKYSPAEILRVATMKCLVDLGVSVAQAGKMLEWMPSSDLGSPFIVVYPDGTVAARHGGRSLDEVILGHDAIAVICIRSIYARVKATLEERTGRTI